MVTARIRRMQNPAYDERPARCVAIIFNKFFSYYNSIF
jgi:hypothetical protein